MVRTTSSVPMTDADARTLPAHQDAGRTDLPGSDGASVLSVSKSIIAVRAAPRRNM